MISYSLCPLHRVCWQPSPEGEPLEKREDNGTSRVHGVIQDFIGGVLDHKLEDDGDIVSDSGWIFCQNYTSINCILSKVMEEEEDSSPGNNNSKLHNLARLEFKFNAGQKGDFSLNTEVFWHLVESFSYSSTLF